MTILFTNDDGVFSGGLYTLFDMLSNEHDVYCIAPLKNRSACSSAKLDTRLYYKKFSERIFGAAGFPIDCVNLACLGLLPKKPDLVISGMNRGPNFGCDLQYSGTVAAAIQATKFSIPSIALSLCAIRAPFYFDAAARFVATHLQEFLTYLEPGVFLNINIPNEAEIETFQMTSGTNSKYAIWPKEHSDYFVVSDSSLADAYEKESDRAAVAAGAVSVSLVSNELLKAYAEN